jgi:plasmid stabilization system protein ParE
VTAAFTVEWAASARDDLDAITAFIAEDSVINALKVLDRTEARAASLATLPSRGRMVPELRQQGVTGYQEVLEQPWRLLYRVSGQRVLVVAVLDRRRNLEDLLLDRFIR